MSSTSLVPSRSIVHVQRQRVVAATLIASVAAWWGSGYAIAATLTVIVALSVMASIIDARTSRIPNRLVLAILSVVVGSIPIIAVLDDRALMSVGGSVANGIIYSGAPILFLIWLVRPSAIGGGDWKLVAALGAGVGIALPFAALVMTAVASLTQIAISLYRRSQFCPFAPSLTVGLVSSILLLPVLSTHFGGPYA